VAPIIAKHAAGEIFMELWRTRQYAGFVFSQNVREKESVQNAGNQLRRKERQTRHPRNNEVERKKERHDIRG